MRTGPCELFVELADIVKISKFNLTRISHLHKILSPTERKLFIIFMVVGAVGIFGILGNVYVGFTKIKPAPGGKFTEGIVGRPTNLNPLLVPQSDADQDLRALIHAGLLAVNADGSFRPMLAESLPQISEDLKTYTVKLRSDLRWPNNKPITAGDVIYTVKSIQDKDAGSYLRNSFRFVKAEQIDDLTVQFKLREPSVTFSENLLTPIIPENSSLDNNLRPVGAGPYQIKRYRFNSDRKITAVELAANENFAPHPPYIKRVTLKFFDTKEKLIDAYKNGELDNLGTLESQGLKTIGAISYDLAISLPEYQAVFFNLEKNPILKSLKVRQALTLATNRQELIDGENTRSPIGGPILAEQETNPQEYSLEKANQLLNEEGWLLKDGNVRKKNDQPLSFILTTNDVGLNTNAAEKLKKQWESIGVQVVLRILPNKELIEKIIPPRDYETILLFENMGHDPDPFPFWHSSQTEAPGLNLSVLKNSEIDKIIVDARSTPDPNIRNELYGKFLNLLQAQSPAIFLIQPLYTYIASKEIKGIEINKLIIPSERFSNIQDWYVKSKRTF